MKKLYGSMPTTMPEGFAVRVHFPVLAMMDKTTGDHRRLDSAGGESRENMPHQIRTQPAATYGHEGAIPSGALFAIEMDDETGIVSGDGFLLDDPIGLMTAKWVQTKVQHKNSVDLAEVKAQYVENLDGDEYDYWINFTQWKVGATTFVGTPAFAEAYGEIVASFDPDGDNTELMASLRQDELIASALADPMQGISCSFTETKLMLPGEGKAATEIVADGLPRVPYDAFLIPEAPRPTKITTDGERLWGHLTTWDACHDGLPGCVRAPRPTDAYASFNKPGAFTERGQVQTGPIFALGGHRSLLGIIDEQSKNDAYGGIENAWSDVRVTEGVIGPWISGHIRPGVDPTLAYAAVASRISGHWVGDRLKAIVSVNAEGFDVAGHPEEVTASFTVADDGTVELIAGFPACLEAEQAKVPASITAEQLDEIVAAVTAKLNASPAPAATDTPSAPAVDAVALATLALLLEES